MNSFHPTHIRVREKGASMATVIMVVVMMLTLGFTVVAIAFNHLNLSFKSNNHIRAKHLAEAVLADAIDKIVKDQEFGLNGSAGDKTVRMVPPNNQGTPPELFAYLPKESEGLLTFDVDLAEDEGIPFSTNNRSEAGVQGAGNFPVPGESFHLVARGRVKNSTHTVEAIITVPKFPYSVAAEGKIESGGGLVVASVKPGVPYDLNYPIHEDDLQPAHLVSNYRESDGGGVGVDLSGENKIYGDLQSSSGVQLEGETSVFGEIRQNADKVKLPIELDAADYDPELKPGVKTVNSGAGSLEVEGYNKSYESLTVDNGIRLNGGVLYVEGDVLVSAGGVSGRGAIIATGNINVYGDGEAASDNQAALIADGDIMLRGSSSAKAKFAGLIYTKGQLDAENLRLAGVFVAAGDGNDSGIKFSNAEVYEDVSKAEIEIETQSVPVPMELPALAPGTIKFETKSVPVGYDTASFQQNLESFRNPNTGPTEPAYLFKTTVEKDGVVGYRAYKVNPTDGTTVIEDTTEDQFVVTGANLGMTIAGQPVTSATQAENAAADYLQAQFTLEGRTLNTTEIDTIKSIARGAFYASSSGYSLGSSAVAYTVANPPDPTGEPGGSEEPFNWSLDLSEFYSAQKTMRIEYWAEYRD